MSTTWEDVEIPQGSFIGWHEIGQKVTGKVVSFAAEGGTDFNQNPCPQIVIELTESAKDLLAQKGFDPLLGARPLRRVIQRDIEDAISEKILMGDLEDGQRVIVDAEGEGILGEFTFKGEEFEEPAAADKPAEDGAATDGETPADATPATEPAESAPADSGDAPQE